MEDNNHNGDASLEGVPTELFENIAENLGATDLKSLRLVSRTVAKKVLRVYANTLFSDYSFFLFNEDSMARALEIARHPAFGKSITRVSIFCDRLGTFPSRKPLNRRWKSIVEQAVAQENAFRERNGALSFLTTLLCVLGQHKKVREIEITSTSMTERRPAGMDPLLTHVGYDFFQICDGFEDATPIVIEGLFLSNVKLRSFSVQTEDDDLVDADAFDPKYCLKVFSEIESLRLPLIGSLPEKPVERDTYLHWLTHARKLKHLWIFDDGEVLSCIMRTRFAMLQTFTVHMWEQRTELRLKELRHFARLNTTLLTLNLERVDIHDCGKHFPFHEQDEPLCPEERDIKKLRKILGVPGKYDDLNLFF